MAGTEWGLEGAAGLLAKEAGGYSGEFELGHRLSAAEGAELWRGQAYLPYGCATHGGAQVLGATAERHVVYGAAGGVQAVVVSLHGAKRYLCWECDCQSPVQGNGRLDRDVCEHAGFAQPDGRRRYILRVIE